MSVLGLAGGEQRNFEKSLGKYYIETACVKPITYEHLKKRKEIPIEFPALEEKKF